MEKTEVVERVNKVIKNRVTLAGGNEIKPEDNLSVDLDLDSLDTLELVMGIEDEFGIEISDESVEKMKIVQNLYDYVESCPGAK